MFLQGGKAVPAQFDMGWFMVFFDGKLSVRLKKRSVAETDVFRVYAFSKHPKARFG